MLRAVSRSASFRLATGRLFSVRPTAIFQQRRHLATSPADAVSYAERKTLVVKTLRHVGDKQEVERYLKLYSSSDLPKYVVIKVSGICLESELETLAGSLSFLHAVGLQPVVVHGIGPQLTSALEEAGIKSHFVNGLRETPPEVLSYVWAINQRENLKLVRALEDRGAHARPIVAGVFEADYLDKAKLKCVGKVVNVNAVPIMHSLECNQLPVLSSLGLTSTGQVLNLKTAMTVTELIKILHPIKVVYLHPHGGLKDESGKIVANIDLDVDYERLVGPKSHLDAKDIANLKGIKTLLEEFPQTSSVSITNAINLPRELFTHAGSGTLIKRSEKVQVYTGLEGVDTLQVQRLIENSLHGKLLPNYMDFLKKKLYRIYVTECYRAVAILTKGSPDEAVPFLDEFAAGPLPENEAVANMLWRTVIKENPQLYWRTTADNVMNSWYLPRSSGSVNSKGWTIFWTGIDFQQSISLLPQALEKPETIRLIPRVEGFGGKRRFSTATGRSQRQGAQLWTTSSRKATSATTNATRGKIGLIGARGHTGAEIIKILDKHPYADITVAGSRGLKGQSVSVLGVRSRFDNVVFSDVPPESVSLHPDVQAWVLALPNDLAHTYVQHIDRDCKGAKVVDLSADYRFDNTWAYGLPERHGQRDKIRSSAHISNPGCYATGMQVTLMPILDLLHAGYPPTVFGVSGYSGAGTTPSRKNDLVALKDNLMPYALLGHMHEKEVSFQLQSLGLPGGIRFMPHVASWFRGIALTISVQLKNSDVSRDTLIQRYREYYKGEPLVNITSDIPEVKDVAESSIVNVGGFVFDVKTGRLVMTTTIDNLLKGAATQCVQNLNLVMGWPELAGIQQ